MWGHRQTAGNTQTWAVPAKELGPVVPALLFGHTKVEELCFRGGDLPGNGARVEAAWEGEGQGRRPGRWSEGAGQP